MPVLKPLFLRQIRILKINNIKKKLLSELEEKHQSGGVYFNHFHNKK